MFSFVIKRLLQAILVMLIVTMIAFLLFQFVGDPVTQMLGQEATEADRAGAGSAYLETVRSVYC